MQMQNSQWEFGERRQSERQRLRLRLAVVYPEKEGRQVRPTYHALTHDISMSGLSLIVEDDIFYEGEVTLVLALPPVQDWAGQESMTATARMTYAIRSSKLNGFKVGLSFVEFKENAAELLRAALEREAAKKP